MIILIGAESSTGKTLMAQKLLEIYKIPYLSVDHIKMGLYRANKNCGFKPDDSNEVIEGHLWPVLKGIIDTNIENNQSIIVEGCYIFPKRIKEFPSSYKNHIIPVFMGFSKQYLKNYFLSGVLKYRSVIEMRENAEERTVEWFIEANEKIKEMCLEHSVRYFEINDDYSEDTEKIYTWIASESERIKHMGISLTKANVSDSELLYEMQIASFKPLLDKYGDYDTNPGAEKIERTINRLNEKNSDYYMIKFGNVSIGAIRIVRVDDLCNLKQLYILPEYQGNGYAQQAILQAESLYSGVLHWELDTIKQEKKLCHLYEKMGYKQTAKEEAIQDGMTLVFYRK